MKKKIIILCVLLCLLAGGVLFTVMQARSFQTAIARIADTTGTCRIALSYNEGQGEPQPVRLEGEKEGLARMHVRYSDGAVSQVECYADLTRSELFINGLSAVPRLQELLPSDSGVYFTLDQVESLLGEKLMDDQIRFYFSEKRISALLDQMIAVPLPRFLLPEALQKEAENGRGYRIPGAKIWLVLEESGADGLDSISFYGAEENLQMQGRIEVSPDDAVEIAMPEPVSDRMFGWLKSGMDFLS